MPPQPGSQARDAEDLGGTGPLSSFRGDRPMVDWTRSSGCVRSNPTNPGPGAPPERTLGGEPVSMQPATRGEPMRRALLSLAALAVLAMVVAISAGCGGSSSSTGTGGNQDATAR